ncbi:MAG: DUF1446 domain-containing protein [Devosiaceae bacterium]|nr:DUF1446 domain-containing protein [Devosiaceae bacterium]
MIRVLVPSGALGLNYDKEALQTALDMNPDVIAIDGGSTDSGPAYLGQGVSKYSRQSTKVEWAGLMQARAQLNVPLIIGSAGTCGSDSAVNWMLEITKEIAGELGQKLKIAVLRSQQKAPDLVAAYNEGRIQPLPHAPEIDAQTFAQCSNIVALAGAEQISAALNTGADIIIAGRTTDTAIISALPLMKNCHAGAAWHGAKIGECGALCATNPQSGVIIVDFDNHGFSVTPTAKSSSATPQTVSAHMLYENSDPYILHEPGGYLDVSNALYQALDERSVRVTGSKWVPQTPYTLKLEGARICGYQSVSFALLRERRYVNNASQWAADVKQKCAEKVIERLAVSTSEFDIQLRLIGHSASFGELETRKNHDSVELGILAIVTANTQQLANEIAKILNPYLLHHPLTKAEEQPTFAFPFSPAEIERGAIYEFCLNHVLVVEDPMQAFSLEVTTCG